MHLFKGCVGGSWISWTIKKWDLFTSDSVDGIQKSLGVQVNVLRLDKPQVAWRHLLIEGTAKYLFCLCLMQWSLKWWLVISASSWYWTPTMVGNLLMATILTSIKPLPVVLHGYPRSGHFLFRFLTLRAVLSLYLLVIFRTSLGGVGAGSLALQLISFYFDVMISGLPQDSPLIFKSASELQSWTCTILLFYSQSNHSTFFETLWSHKRKLRKEKQ